MNNNTIPRDVMLAYAAITEDVELFNAISKDIDRDRGKVIPIEEKREAREAAREVAAPKPEPKPKDAGEVTTESSEPDKAVEHKEPVPGTEKAIKQQKAAVEAAKNISEKPTPTAVPGTEKYIKQQKAAIVAEKAVQEKPESKDANVTTEGSKPDKEKKPVTEAKPVPEKPVQQKKPQQKPENKSETETREDKLKKVRKLIKEGKGPVTPLKEMSYSEKVDLIKESVELRDGHKLSPVEIDSLVNTFCTERIKNHVKNKYSIINPKWVELHPEDVTMSNKKDYDMFFKIIGTKVYMAVNLVPYYNRKGNWTNDCKVWSTEAPAENK